MPLRPVTLMVLLHCAAPTTATNRGGGQPLMVPCRGIAVSSGPPQAPPIGPGPFPMGPIRAPRSVRHPPMHRPPSALHPLHFLGRHLQHPFPWPGWLVHASICPRMLPLLHSLLLLIVRCPLSTLRFVSCKLPASGLVTPFAALCQTPSHSFFVYYQSLFTIVARLVWHLAYLLWLLVFSSTLPSQNDC